MATVEQMKGGAASTKEAMVFLGGLSKKGLWELVRDGKLVTVKLGRRRLYSRTSLVEYLASLPDTAGGSSAPATPIRKRRTPARAGK